jgi:phage gpG-like protein
VKKLSKIFKKTIEGLNNFSEPLKGISQYMEKEIDINFKQGGSRLNNRPWKSLKPSTLKQKNRKYPSRPILVRTGRMRRNFQHSLTKDRLEISNKSDYFKYHQSNKPRKKLPRRVMLNILTRQKTEIIKFFSKYIEKLTK